MNDPSPQPDRNSKIIEVLRRYRKPILAAVLLGGMTGTAAVYAYNICGIGCPPTYFWYWATGTCKRCP